MTTVVNISNDKYDVFIGRDKGTIPEPPKPGCYGNPFPVKQYGRENSIEMFVVYFYDRVEKDKQFRNAVLKLKGLRLGCFCAPLECHGHVIKQWLDEHR